MRIQVLFNETSVLVPCGDGNLTVKELVDKAIVRFKKVLTKHEDDEIEVRSLRLVDSGSFVAMDDVVADVLEDKEAVVLEFELIPHYIEDPTSDLQPPENPMPSFTGSNLDDEDHAPFTPGDLHDPLLGPALPNIEEDYDDPALGMANGDHTSQELHPLQHLGDDPASTTPTSLQMGRVSGGASQDLDMVNATWHSQNSGSQPDSPRLHRKSAEWPDTGYSSKSQDSYSQSQPKSQETFQHHHPGGGVGPAGSAGGDALSFSASATPTGDHHPGGTPNAGGAGGGRPAHPHHHHHHENGDFPTHHSPHPPHPHRHHSTSSAIPTPHPPPQLRQHSHSHSVDFGAGAKGAMTGETPNHTPSHVPHQQQHQQKGGLKSLSSAYGGGLDDSGRFRSPDTFSPVQPPPTLHPGGSMDVPPPLGRSYDGYHGFGYGGYGHLPSLDEGGGAYDKHAGPGAGGYDHFKRRPMSMYNSRGVGSEAGLYHTGAAPYGTIPPNRHLMAPGHYPGRPGFPPPPDMYDMRAGHPMGRFGRPHDPYHSSRLAHTLSHEKLDGSSSSGGAGGIRTRPHHMMSREEEFGAGPMDMFLSQPTSGYFSYEQPPGSFGVPMMGHMYDPRMAMGGPSSGVSLSQPGVMLSHRPHSMIEVERMGHRQHMGGVDRSSIGGKSGSMKSAESLERAGLSMEDYEDIDPAEEDRETQPKGRNPFQRDFRKSIFRDGSVYSNWMDRVINQEICEPESENDVPEFDGEAMLHSLEPPKSQDEGEEEDEDEEEEESEGEDDDEYGKIHIVELHKGDEPLGIQLTHYTSPEDIDVGVYIASIDPEGFAAKSGKLQVQDRILACNGVDFTKDMSNSQVECIVTEKMQLPLLKMAISRGAFRGSLQATGGSGFEVGGVASEVGVGVAHAVASAGVSVDGSSVDGSGSNVTVGVAVGEEVDGGETTPSRPTIKTVAPPAAPSQAPSLARTNTRQIGARHTIQLQKGSKGFGFGLTSRDVKTDEQSQPIYVKVIHHGGSAYQDGRLRIGDRILEVNGVDVCGMSRPEVVQLLKSSQETVTLLVSRQEVVEEQEELDQDAPAGDGSAQPVTVNKTVLNLSIPLHNCGPAGLGVTVYTKSSGVKGGRGEMGVYIKSIVAGGAAALDGRLHKNDQVLSVNGHNLLGHSNHEAMDILKQAMADHYTVQLVVARRVGQTTPSMAALGEEPEEDEGDGGHNNEVGIDVPTSTAPPTYSRSSSTAAEGLASGSGHSLLEATVVGSGAGSTHSLVGGVGGSSHNLLGVASSVSLQSQTSVDSKHSKSHALSLQTSLPDQPSRGSMRERASTLATSSPSRVRGQGAEQGLRPSSMHRSQDMMGSGEFYDRLEPLATPTTPPPPTSLPLLAGHAPSSLPHMFAHISSLYDEAAASSGHGYHPHTNQSSLDRRDLTSLDQRGVSRQQQQPHPVRSHPPHMSRDLTGGGAGALSSGGSNRQPLSPSDIEYQLFSPTGSGSSRENTMPRQHQKQQQQHQRNSSYDSRTSSSHPSDSASSTVGIGYPGGMTDRPIRGSGRKDRNRPERGSGRNHTPQVGGASASPELVMNGYATVPRSNSTNSRERGATPTSLEAASLENLRLDDSESNMAFRRDNPGRISITKKTKKNPRQDFAHLRYDNVAPLVEGEKPLMRAGSDSFLNEHNNVGGDFMQAMEIGPNLGLAKSSSLESLHNVMHHTIKRDLVDDGSDLRNRSTRNSFRRAVDRSYEAGAEGQGQRGVDVDHDSAMISFTKSPHGAKTKKKGSFFQKVFKKKKKDKSSPANNRKARGISMEISPASLTAEERDQLMRHYTLQLRPQQAQGAAATTTNTLPTMTSDPRFTTSLPASVRHSMPVLDDYDSPDSPDEMLLASMAKV